MLSQLHTSLAQLGFDFFPDSDKCRIFSFARAPVDLIGTGSYLPEKWSETYATADIIAFYRAHPVKAARYFLLPN